MSKLLVSVGMPGAATSWRACLRPVDALTASAQETWAQKPSAMPQLHAAASPVVRSSAAFSSAAHALNAFASRIATPATAVRPRYAGIRPRGTPPV